MKSCSDRLATTRQNVPIKEFKFLQKNKIEIVPVPSKRAQPQIENQVDIVLSKTPSRIPMPNRNVRVKKIEVIGDLTHKITNTNELKEK
jgi:hypothetical protein